jgi:hypothetical protein
MLELIDRAASGKRHRTDLIGQNLWNISCREINPSGVQGRVWARRIPVHHPLEAAFVMEWMRRSNHLNSEEHKAVRFKVWGKDNRQLTYAYMRLTA